MHEELLPRIINVGITNEYSEVNTVFKSGHTYKFDLEQILETEDAN